MAFCTLTLGWFVEVDRLSTWLMWEFPSSAGMIHLFITDPECSYRSRSLDIARTMRQYYASTLICERFLLASLSYYHMWRINYFAFKTFGSNGKGFVREYR